MWNPLERNPLSHYLSEVLFSGAEVTCSLGLSWRSLHSHLRNHVLVGGLRCAGNTFLSWAQDVSVADFLVGALLDPYQALLVLV